MWHWLHNEKLHRYNARYLSCALSVTLHALILALCVAVYKTDHSTLFLTIKKDLPSERPVHFVEFPPMPVARTSAHTIKEQAACTHLERSAANTAPVAPAAPPVVKQNPTKNSAAKTPAESSPTKTKPALTYSKEDVAASQYKELYKKIMDSWRAPRGLEGDCTCELEAIISPNGTIKSIITKKPSGILMFDIAARSALSAIEFPRWSRGKSIVVAFNN